MIVRNGNTVKIIPNYTHLDKLESINYLVKFDGNSNEYYLVDADPFTLPSKIYGDVDIYCDRYLNTFNKGKSNKGILLKGLKGTGKSLLAKSVCINSKLPVIIVSSAYHGTEFNSFISSIKQECVIFIDEFEKIYSGDDSPQESLLSLFDGAFEGKKLFLLTANDGDIHDAYINRPGRVHYVKEYGSLPIDVIGEICDDLLDNKDYKDEVIEISTTLGEVSMDTIVTLINESNMYNESPKESYKFLNIGAPNTQYRITWEDKGCTFNDIVYTHPLIDDDFFCSDRVNDGKGEYIHSELSRNAQTSNTKYTIDSNNNCIHCLDDNGIKFTVTVLKNINLVI